MARSNRTLYAVLGVLSRRSATGYEIHKLFEETHYLFWNESYGQLYPALKKIAAEGWAEAVDDSSNKSIKRTRYTLTRAGREELTRWLNKPASQRPVRDEVILRANLGGDADPEALRVMLREVEMDCTARLGELAELNPEDFDLFEQLSNDWSETYLTARRDWARRCLERLEEEDHQVAKKA